MVDLEIKRNEMKKKKQPQSRNKDSNFRAVRCVDEIRKRNCPACPKNKSTRALWVLRPSGWFQRAPLEIAKFPTGAQPQVGFPCQVGMLFRGLSDPESSETKA